MASAFCCGVFQVSPSTPGVRLRVGEQALQGFRFAPFARLSCLRDMSLEPMNVPFSMTPVDLMPCKRWVGGRTNRDLRQSSQSFLSSSALPPESVSQTLSR
jgi:hypothetical protein